MTREKMLAIAKPILFNAEMVEAIRDNRKTATRRVIKAPVLSEERAPDRISLNDGSAHFSWNGSDVIGGFTIKQPYQPGDILYVRETWNRDPFRYDRFIYKADGYGPGMPWRPSIHMPKEAARIFLRVTDVQVERLRDITHGEIAREGIMTKGSPGSPERVNPFFVFRNLWNSTLKPTDLSIYGWDANPWVWVIEFERVEAEK